MPYVKTYKTYRIFKNEDGKFYCFDKINRKSLLVDSEKELRDEIDRGWLEFESTNAGEQFAGFGSPCIQPSIRYNQL